MMLKKTLEDYILEVETRGNNSRSVIIGGGGGGGGGGGKTTAIDSGDGSNCDNGAMRKEAVGAAAAAAENLENVDVWRQLQLKENDLTLAAELGNALLASNADLKQKLDSTTEEFAKRLEMVEQDRHQLRRKLATVDAEWEARQLELQQDVRDAHAQLSAKDAQLRTVERERATLCADLTAQNARLTERLREASATHQQLAHEVDALRAQCTHDKNSLREHLSSVGSIYGEIELLTQQKRAVERRAEHASAECARLQVALDEALQQLHTAERHLYERNTNSNNNALDDAVVDSRQNLMVGVSDEGGGDGGPKSLLAELDEAAMPTAPPRLLLLNDCIVALRQLRALVDQLRRNRSECSGMHQLQNADADDDEEEGMVKDDNDSGLHSNTSDNSGEQQHQFSAGQLSETAHELVRLVLETDVMRLVERLEMQRVALHERDGELGRRAAHILELGGLVQMRDMEVAVVREERDRARADAAHLGTSDQLLAQARLARDQAMQRCAGAELQLGGARVELAQSNALLLEAIQQKVALSEQLEQWQVDMQELLNEQLRSKLTRQENCAKRRQTTATDGATQRQQRSSSLVSPETRQRLLKFFQR